MAKAQRQNAFTLIELLASMGVLAILVLICGNIFSSSTRAWNYGSARVEQNTLGRAVMEMLHRQLSDSITGTALVFHAVTTAPANNLSGDTTPYNLPALNWPCTDLQFISVSVTGQQQVQPDEMRAYHYFVFETNEGNPPYLHYQLWNYLQYGWVTNTAAWANSYSSDSTRLWYQASGNWLVNPNSFQTYWTNFNTSVMANNLTTFTVLCYGQNNMLWSPGTSENYNYQLPYYADVLLGTLSEADARKAAQLSASGQAASPQLQAFVAANEKRFVMRVYFVHRAALPAPLPAMVPPS